MTEPHYDLIQRIYDESYRLWCDTGVERHAEGHPGVAGSSGEWSDWTVSQGTLDGAIEMLRIIRERKFGSVD